VRSAPASGGQAGEAGEWEGGAMVVGGSESRERLRAAVDLDSGGRVEGETRFVGCILYAQVGYCGRSVRGEFASSH
jgi:hypothetical protein